jgi:CRP-like cAMP-binding protein
MKYYQSGSLATPVKECLGALKATAGQQMAGFITHMAPAYPEQDMAVTNIEERLYKVLCNVAKEHGEKRPQGVMIQFPLTHEDLSFLIGTHRVTVTRAMKALKETGKIIFENRRLIIPSLATSENVVHAATILYQEFVPKLLW